MSPDEYGIDVGCLGKAHVGDVAVAQIDFGRRACPLHDDQIGVAAQPLETVHESGRNASRFPRIITCLQRRPALAPAQ